jgi:hypothetical protein
LTRAERAMKQAKKYGAANEGESEGVVYLDGLNGKRKES